MISVLDIGPGVLGLNVSGKIEKPDIDRAIAAWDAIVAVNPKFSVYIEIHGLDSMTPQALLRDLQAGISRIGDLSHIDRFAVVTDQQIVKTLVGMEGRLSSHWFDTRVFTPADKLDALTWVKAPRDFA